MDQKMYEDKSAPLAGKMKELQFGCEDIFNRLIATDNYLDKYLPYNTFTQICETFHMVISKDQAKLLEDYESAKMQNYLVDILQDLGRHE